MLDLTNLSASLSQIQNQSYLVILVLMIVEGPIVTFLASLAASIGVFNIYWILVLSILGNSIPDKLFYLIGRYSRKKTENRFLNFFNLDSKKVKTFEKHLENNLVKALIFSKFVPPFPIPGMFLAGFTKTNFKRFFIITTAFDILISIIFVITGYFSGVFATEALRYFELESIFLPIIVVIVILIFPLTKWAYRKISLYLKNSKF
ncbi:VTT domain-containing protein [Candidatus Pacearchaeota archaeon]|nr:VTT domain-containing protein [Candidatus Pacearchaeota archaeon]